ncbi:hypothetical protein PENTCL1PPCAC_13544, partial [Pristionchus entomophagus]
PLSLQVPSFVPKFARMQMDNGGGGNAGLVVPPPPSTSGFRADAKEFVPRVVPRTHGGTTYYHQANRIGQQAYDAVAGRGLGAPLDQRGANIVVNTDGTFSYQPPAPPAPHTGKFRPRLAATNTKIAQFISPALQMEFRSRHLAKKAKPETLYPELPQAIKHMFDIVPLEVGSVKPPSGYQQSVYKATSARDGQHYVMRRVHAFCPINANALAPAESWMRLQAAHVVQLRECFPTWAFRDDSLILVYDYHPFSVTLKERHFGRGGGAGGCGGGGVTMVDAMTDAKLRSIAADPTADGVVPEELMWQYVVQLTAALKSIHSSGLAARSIDVSKVIVMGKCKLLLSACGVMDLVMPDHQQIQQQQTEDMIALGRLVLVLATGNQHAGRRDLVARSISMVAAHYSQDMKDLIMCLLGPAPRKTVADVMTMIGARFYHHIQALQSGVDLLENEAARELENGRLFRLLCKLNTIVERPEHNMDTRWAETGDLLLIKLFRDYVFHQVTESGKPWMDMAHIVSCMNKLKAGVSEEIDLLCRDEDTVVRVSYKGLRRSIDAAFAELSRAMASARGGAATRGHARRGGFGGAG